MRVRSLLPAALCLAFLVQCVWFVRTQSLAADELDHVFAGLAAWRTGRLDFKVDHPPLTRLLHTLPLLSTDAHIAFNASRAHVVRPSPELIAWRTRLVNAFLGLCLAALVWASARRLFSEGGANLALALYAFSPNLVAHFSVACTDGPATLAFFATAMLLWQWRGQPSGARAAALGIAFGCLLAAKFSAPPLFALTFLIVLVAKPTGIARRLRQLNWRAAATMTLGAFLVVWASYFFHVSQVTLDEGGISVRSPGRNQVPTAEITLPLHATIPVPAGEYLEGFLRVVRHNRRGHPSFFLGTVSQTGGWKAYFPTVVLLKWPPVVLLLTTAAALLALARRLPLPRHFWMVMLFPVVYMAFAIFSQINIGDRHILPVYPFLLLLCAALWTLAQRRLVRVLLIGAVALQIGDAGRYAPDYLSYFTPLVKAEESYQLLTDSNLDWGQGLLALREYEAEHPDETMHLAYFGRVEPSVYGIRALPLPEGHRVSGTVVVSATHLSGQLLDDPGAYQWVLQFPRTSVLNHSLHVFKVRGEPPP